MLDVADEATHAVIGSRSYSRDPDRVAALARAAMAGLSAGGVAPVVKHIPGHGRARVDSHLELPVVDGQPRANCERDFAPFRALADAPAAMTAHVVYTAIDAERPARRRRKLSARSCAARSASTACLFSDDLSMKALGGPFDARARAAFAAGVDIALHCNGDLAEARPVAEAAPPLEGRSLARAQALLAQHRRRPRRVRRRGRRARLVELFPTS